MEPQSVSEFQEYGIKLVEAKYLENFIMEVFTYDTFEIIDFLERQYHQKKILVDTRGMGLYQRSKNTMLVEDQEPILLNNHPTTRQFCILWDMDKYTQDSDSDKILLKFILNLITYQGFFNQTHKKVMIRLVE